MREAYVALVADGILNSRHGGGTFVTRIPAVEDRLDMGLASFAQEIRAAGYTPNFPIPAISLATGEAPLAVHTALNIRPFTKLLHGRRVIYADKVPAAYVIDYFAPWVAELAGDWSKFSGDMLEYLGSELQIDLGHLHQKYRAALADAEIAGQLQLPQGLPVICVTTVLNTFDNRPIVYTESYLNPLVYELDAVRVIHK